MTVKSLRALAASSDEGWCAAAFELLRRHAARYELLSSDDVWRALDEVSPSEPRLMGAVFRKAMAASVVLPIPKRERSRRRICHGRSIRLWHSRIYQPKASR
jgi:hypothetical protein